MSEVIKKLDPITNSKMEERKLVGGYVSEIESEYLQLYATAENCSVSSLLRTIISDFIVFQLENNRTESKLVLEILHKVIKEWDRRYSKKSTNVATYEKYMAEINKSLTKKKLSDSVISRIIEGIVYTADKRLEIKGSYLHDEGND